MKGKNTQNIIILFFKENKLIIALLLLFFLIKLFFITTRYHLPIWDEAVYIGMGKYIYSAGSAGLWEMIRPFGLPLFVGALWSIGLDPVYFSQLLAIMFSSATIFMTYLIAKELFDKKIALLSSFLLAIAPIFFLYSIYALTEIPSTFFVLLALYMYLKKKYFLTGIFAGIALLFRFPQGIIIIPIALAILIDWFFEGKTRESKRKRTSNISTNKIKTYRVTTSRIEKKQYTVLIRRMFFYGLGFAMIILPFLLLNFVMYNEYTSKATDALFRPLILAAPHQGNVFESIRTDSLGAQLYNIFYYIIMMIKNNIIFLLSLAAAFMLILKFKERTKILSLTLIIYLLYYSYIINKQERFMITFLPIVCILTAYMLFYLIRKIFPEKSASIKDYNTLNDIMRKSALASLIIIAVLLTSIYAIRVDAEYYYWLHKNDQRPEIITGYYQLINDLDIKGPILISEPVLAAFTNNKLIEYTYYNEVLLISNEWEADEDIAAVTYTYNTVPCLEEDEPCKNARESLLNYFMSNYEMYYKGNFYGQDTYIFLKR